MAEEYFHPKLLCCVKKLKYNFEKKTGYIYIPEYDKIEMGACVDLFISIDEEVERIFTFAGDKENSAYFKCSGDWKIRFNNAAASVRGVAARYVP